MEHKFENYFLSKKINYIFKCDINKVKDINNMFSDCSSLKSLPDISVWNTNHVENMKKILTGCSSLKSLPYISNYNTVILYYLFKLNIIINKTKISIILMT